MRSIYKFPNSSQNYRKISLTQWSCKQSSTLNCMIKLEENKFKSFLRNRHKKSRKSLSKRLWQNGKSKRQRSKSKLLNRLLASLRLTLKRKELLLSLLLGRVVEKLQLKKSLIYKYRSSKFQKLSKFRVIQQMKTELR